MCLNIMASGQPGTLVEFYMATKAQIALHQAKMIPAQIAEALKLARENKSMESMGEVQPDPMIAWFFSGWCTPVNYLDMYDQIWPWFFLNLDYY